MSSFAPLKKAPSQTQHVWSAQQVEIFDFFKSGTGNLIVRARAGTAKTTTICAGVEYVAPGLKVLLAAFNGKIAKELQIRFPKDGPGPVTASTLHSVGLKCIREASPRAKPDDTGQVDIDRAREVCGPDAPNTIVFLVKRLASLLKGVSPFGNASDAEDVAVQYDCLPDENLAVWTLERVAALAVQARDAAKVRDPQNRVSFDDMIYCAIACDFAMPLYDVVVIDEAQDMNASQLILAMRMCKKNGRIVVVGDDRQAIYGFRGADAGGLDRLKTELNARELGLNVTYRCGASIVALARTLVPDYLAAPNAHEGTVDKLRCDMLVATAQPGDFVLSRKNAPLMPLCLAFLRRGIPARIEGRNVAEGLKNIVSKLNARSIPEFVTRIGTWEARQVQRYGKDEKFAAKIETVRDQAETLLALADGCSGVSEVMARLERLFSDTAGKSAANVVVLSSVHRAKGLEAIRVFVLVDTLSGRSAEENNIAYVAYTRAKAHLTLVSGVAS